MENKHRQLWKSAGGICPDSWHFISLEKLLLTPKSIYVGVMYPGKHSHTGVPLIKVSDVKQGNIPKQPNFKISQDVDKKYQRTRITGQELLITLVGNPGDCVIATKKMFGWNAARALAVLTLKEPELRSWIKLILLSRPAKHIIDSRLNTTVQKTLNLKDIKELPIPLPPLPTRRHLCGIMEKINDKIELNRKMNETLEAMAQALFKSWFVNFDPVIDNALAAGNAIPDVLAARAAARNQLGENRKPLPEEIRVLFPSEFEFTDEMGRIPKGWEVKPIGNILVLAYGKSLAAKNRIPGPYPVYGSGGIAGCHDKAITKGPGIIVGRKGTVGSIYWEQNDFFPIDTVFYVESKAPVPLYWIYQSLNQMDIASLGADSAVPGVNRNAVYAKTWIIPDYNILQKYWTHIEPQIQKGQDLKSQNEILSTLRDTLLPKLLSGELRIPDAEQLVSEQL